MAAVAAAATLAAGLALTPGSLSLGDDPVTDAADGLDSHPGARELGAQPGQVDVDGVRAERVGLVVPDMLGDRATVGDTRGTPHENLQDAQFGPGESGPMPADHHLPRGRVELEFPDHHPGRLAERRPALRSAGASRAVSISTGVARPPRRSCCTRSRPDSRGMRQSSTATSYW